MCRRSQAHLLQIGDVLDRNCGRERKTPRHLIIQGIQREEVLPLSVQGEAKVEHAAELIYRLEVSGSVGYCIKVELQFGEPERRIGKGDVDEVETTNRCIYPRLSPTRDHEVFIPREVHER